MNNFYLEALKRSKLNNLIWLLLLFIRIDQISNEKGLSLEWKKVEIKKETKNVNFFNLLLFKFTKNTRALQICKIK